MKSLFYLFLITALFFASCKDDDMTIVQLPPVTSEGLNTFGCLVNGEPWVAMTDNNEVALDAIHNPFLNEFQLNAGFVKSQKDENFLVYTLNFFGEGTYPLAYLEEMFYDYTNGKAYELDTTRASILNVTKFDTNNKTVSGSFEFTVFRGSDTLKITEGRFDAKFRN